VKVCKDDFIKKSKPQSSTRRQQATRGAGLEEDLESQLSKQVKHFFWRMMHESHPLRCSLAAAAWKLIQDVRFAEGTVRMEAISSSNAS
jgi:hypothetical protein